MDNRNWKNSKEQMKQKGTKKGMRRGFIMLS